MPWDEIAQAEALMAGERGTVRKDWGGRLPIALVFPNTYHLGMSSLALHSLYRLWNARDDVVCERVFIDPSRASGHSPSRASGRRLAPPISLESGSPLDYFPVVAFTLSYEMDYFHVVELLRAADIPPHAADRDETHPLLLAGGPAVSANPEPLAPLLDTVVIGEIEPIFDPLTDTLHHLADDREATRNALAQLPGLYLPNSQSPIPNIQRQWLSDLDAYPTHSAILTPNTEFADMGLIEIARGCGRGCRFCLAGYTYRPPRQRSVENIVAQAKTLLQHTDRLGLVSAAVSDHTEIDRLAVELRRLDANLSVSSLRADSLTETLVRALAESGAQTLTIAPEAGSVRLRRAITKTQSEDDVLRAVELAAAHDIAQLKLYFMLGLPTEDEDDVQALVDLALACAGRFPRQVTANVTPFVPKAHTPFQRVAQTPAKVVKKRLDYVERKLWQASIAVKSESPAWAEIQGTLARGDRHLAEALLAVDKLTPGKWKQALADIGLSLRDQLAERPANEPLPWEFIEGGLR